MRHGELTQPRATQTPTDSTASPRCPGLTLSVHLLVRNLCRCAGTQKDTTTKKSSGGKIRTPQPSQQQESRPTPGTAQNSGRTAHSPTAAIAHTTPRRCRRALRRRLSAPKRLLQLWHRWGRVMHKSQPCCRVTAQLSTPGSYLHALSARSFAVRWRGRP